MNLGTVRISIEQALRDVQCAKPEDLALVVAYLVCFERKRQQPDRALLQRVAKITDHRTPHEEHIALYHRNAQRTWTETLIFAKRWAREEVVKLQRGNENGGPR